MDNVYRVLCMLFNLKTSSPLSSLHIFDLEIPLWINFLSVHLTFDLDGRSWEQWLSVFFQAIMHHEGHMDDGLNLSRSQHEESRTARVIRSTVFLFNRFIRYFFYCYFCFLPKLKMDYS